mmetsp:Transcript_5116/g.11763  ORF Transcript_5116/g.11763 Transcript_5116/m.11763 type:complete len:226 (+) Transcript_5116:795-1472(+)
MAGTPPKAMLSKPSPKMPSKTDILEVYMLPRPRTSSTCAKEKLWIFKAPIETSSEQYFPVTAPPPYWKKKEREPSWNVLDFFASKPAWKESSFRSSRPWRVGTHKLDEPVSNRTLIFCPGVPTSISPEYCAFNWFLNESSAVPVPLNNSTALFRPERRDEDLSFFKGMRMISSAETAESARHQVKKLVTNVMSSTRFCPTRTTRSTESVLVRMDPEKPQAAAGSR